MLAIIALLIMFGGFSLLMARIAHYIISDNRYTDDLNGNAEIYNALIQNDINNVW